MKGVVWYQGEQNATTPHGYGALFKTMISDWRQRWHLGDFPFLFVQIASYHAPQTYPSEGGWAWLREEQLKALALPHTAMASAIDLGNPKDVHPRDKADVGHRLALAARHVAYGETLESSGPMYDSIEIKGNTIQISFQHVGGGLQIGIPPWTSELKPPVKLVRLTGFAIAGAERKWFFAEALIDGNRVYVSSEKVPNPVAVRYDWASFPLGNLYNAEGLPASPFRTDHWEEPINF
jgi:sialate O-acetylesterase